MRIRNPPTFIMSTSLIMSLIMTLLVFQCASQRSCCGSYASTVVRPAGANPPTPPTA